jgi:RNA polymerase sigma factor (sigma-70 family)
MSNNTAVFIIEDDLSVRDALSLLLGLRGYAVTMFADAESFLKAYRPEWRGCLLIDIRMPGMDGLALQKYLRDIDCQMPAIIMTGHGDVDSARNAFRSQAVDFLEKPLDHVKLMNAIEDALKQQATVEEQESRRSAFEQLMASLTQREVEVLELVVAGRHNREIAELLTISVRTVEVHKSRMMTKLQSENVPDLVRLYLLNRPLRTSEPGRS